LSRYVLARSYHYSDLAVALYVLVRVRAAQGYVGASGADGDGADLKVGLERSARACMLIVRRRQPSEHFRHRAARARRSRAIVGVASEGTDLRSLFMARPPDIRHSLRIVALAVSIRPLGIVISGNGELLISALGHA